MLSGLLDMLRGWLAAAGPWMLWLMLFLGCVAGLVLNIVGLPGIWLMVLCGIGFVWATTPGVYAGWTPVFIVAGIGLLAELAEFVAGAAGAKTAGGTKRGMAGAILGGLLGAILFSILIPIPLLGTILGAIVGAGLGAFLIEWGWVGTESGQATTIAYGAAKGRVVGMILKTVFGLIIAAILLAACLPTGGVATTAPTSVPAPQIADDAATTSPMKGANDLHQVPAAAPTTGPNEGGR
jgi:uncharacterized protein